MSRKKGECFVLIRLYIISHRFVYNLNHRLSFFIICHRRSLSAINGHRRRRRFQKNTDDIDNFEKMILRKNILARQCFFNTMHNVKNIFYIAISRRDIQMTLSKRTIQHIQYLSTEIRDKRKHKEKEKQKKIYLKRIEN